MLWSFNKKVPISDHDGKGKSQEGHEMVKRKNILLNLCDNYVTFTISQIFMWLFIATISYLYFFGISPAPPSESLGNKPLTDTITISVGHQLRSSKMNCADRNPETNSAMNNEPNTTEFSDPAPYLSIFIRRLIVFAIRSGCQEYLVLNNNASSLTTFENNLTNECLDALRMPRLLAKYFCKSLDEKEWAELQEIYDSAEFQKLTGDYFSN